MQDILTIDLRAQAVSACGIPEDLHPLSASALTEFLNGQLPTVEFARLFSLANSAYLSATDCILSNLEAVTTVATAI